MARYTGLNGQLTMDVSALAAGTTQTVVPNLADWSLDAGADAIDVTCMGDGNKVNLLGYSNFKLTISGFADASSDVVRVLGDGKQRKFVFCDDTTQATKKYWSGLCTAAVSTSGGTGKAVAITINLEAAGTIAQTYSATAPTP